MRHIDEDTITQAVIARHTAAGDPRLRELMTSLVQHLHAFAREVKLNEAEWTAGLHFLSECARVDGDRDLGRRDELALLSDALGLSTLVAALDRRKAKGDTEWTMPAAFLPHVATGPAAAETGPGNDDDGDREPCFVRGRVLSADGQPIAGAEVCVWPSSVDRAVGVCRSAADGAFVVRCDGAGSHPIPHEGPVGRLLHALGRHPWRPAHLQFMISAPGHERLVTQVFRRGDPYLDSDAVFGVRSSLVADWVRHPPGRAPDGRTSAVPFCTLDFEFVLNSTRGDKP